MSFLTMSVVYSDASGSGFGGYTIEHGSQVAHGHWSDWEACQSSTWHELKAVLNAHVLQSFAAQLQSDRVRWFTDKQNVLRIVLNGSKTPILQKLALEIFQMCVAYHIIIGPEWIPRECNEVADYINKTVDYDDWMLHLSIFVQLDYFRGQTVLIGLLIHTIGRLNDLILGLGPLILRLLTLLLLTGEMTITGGAHQWD